MNRNSKSYSIFSQRLDRAIFALYFLGAIVPLVALGYVFQRYVLPAITDDTYAISLTGAMIGIGILCLTCFLALRHLAHNVIAQMDAHNKQLKTILLASEKLSQAPHAQAVAHATVKCASMVVKARAVYLFLQSDLDKELALVDSLGKKAPALYEKFQATFDTLIEGAVHERRAVTLESSSKGKSESAHSLGAAIAVPLIEEKKPVGVLILVRTDEKSSFSPEETDAVSMLATISSVALTNSNLHDAQRNFFTHVMGLLVSAVDAHVAYRNGHSESVARLSNQLAREMGLSENQLQTLHFASLLHDIGMLKIDPALHSSPIHYQKHSAIAYRMLSRIRLWAHLAPIVHHHHEWFDGSGYPEGLAGDAIPLESRIIALTDAFDAMTRDDNRQGAMSLIEASDEIRNSIGTQFDPTVAEAFLTLAERGEISTSRSSS